MKGGNLNQSIKNLINLSKKKSSNTMNSSLLDTECSTPDNDTVEKIVKNDARRYVKKGTTYSIYIPNSIIHNRLRIVLRNINLPLFLLLWTNSTSTCMASLSCTS